MLIRLNNVDTLDNKIVAFTMGEMLGLEAVVRSVKEIVGLVHDELLRPEAVGSVGGGRNGFTEEKLFCFDVVVGVVKRAT